MSFASPKSAFAAPAEWAGWPLDPRIETPSNRRPPAESARLASLAMSGDRHAFAQLYREFAPVVHGILLAQVPAHEAQDLLQDVFLQALRSLHDLADPARFGGWLCCIARNRALDRLRQRGRARGEEAHEEPDDTRALGPARALEQEEEAQRALDQLRTLPAAYREPLVLRLVEGLSGPEIAERCGMTPGSVRVNLCRGMRLLRERLGAPSEGKR